MNINQILATENRSSPRGAPMGASDNFDDDHPILHVQRVVFVDGDYGADGTYWGGGPGTTPLWCGFNETSRVYVRAKNRKEAIAAILDQYDATITEGLDVDSITTGFIECLCWAESGDTESTLGDNAGPELLADGQYDKARDLVVDFLAYCSGEGIELGTLDEEQIGHDLWLTMHGHGAGFWDRGLGKLGDDLTKAAKTFSMECWLGDDELIYLD